MEQPEMALEPEDDVEDYNYEAVIVEEEPLEDDVDDVSEDLDHILANMRLLSAGGKAAPPKVGALPEGQRLPAVDDFLRNFLVRTGLRRTLECFETEWYEAASRGALPGSERNALVPEVYVRNAELEETLRQARAELDTARAISAKATGTWDKFRKERDFHRMHHKRIAQEKGKLLTDIKRLQQHYAQYEPTIKELRHKYEVAMKEKMLLQLERDRLTAKLDHIAAKPAPAAPAPAVGSPKPATGATIKLGATTTEGRLESGFPAVPAARAAAAVAAATQAPPEVKAYSLQKTFKGHAMSVAAVACHPVEPIVATGSDDGTWKMWSLPAGELIMSGDGHKDWVAAVAFHPAGTHLASGSGDASVKLWDFGAGKCTVSFTEHAQAVWGVAFHELGGYLASCSLDHAVKIWDLGAGRCRSTLRGHVDSVNGIAWQPGSYAVCSASSDKTVSLWDARTGLCVQTFYGHGNSCNKVAFSPVGTVVASSDADGAVKLWDVRMVAELATVAVGPHPANDVAFDRTGKLLAIACDDGRVAVYGVPEQELVAELSGHEAAAQAVGWDARGKFLISAGSDKSFRMWS